jgi:hypothetical protein|tara:strand:- start:428 stop:544 length:117 start_codon:yes stop_codon:yes gene_type:complete
MANTSGEKELKTDWPEQPTESMVLEAQESDTADHWGSL